MARKKFSTRPSLAPAPQITKPARAESHQKKRRTRKEELIVTVDVGNIAYSLSADAVAFCSGRTLWEELSTRAPLPDIVTEENRRLLYLSLLGRSIAGDRGAEVQRAAMAASARARRDMLKDSLGCKEVAAVAMVQLGDTAARGL